MITTMPEAQTTMIDLQVRDVLRTAYASLLADQDPLEEIFRALDAGERERIKRFFANNEIPVELGFPAEPPGVPGIYLVLGPSQESMEGHYGDALIGTQWYERAGAIFDANLVCSCWSPNADVTSWIAWVTASMLVRYRLDLSAAGLDTQRISMTDFRVAPEMYPTRVYWREVRLMARTHVVVTVAQWPPIREVTITPQADDPSGTISRIVVR